MDSRKGQEARNEPVCMYHYVEIIIVMSVDKVYVLVEKGER